MISQVLLGLSILIILHELGHFMAARLFGIKVEKFFLFFDINDIKLFSFKKRDTEYGVGWLPLGGYVKIAGMIDESLDTNALKQPPQPWEFRSKPAWQKLIVMIGGVTVNLFLGIGIFAIITYLFGESYVPMNQVKYGIVASEQAKELGLQTGDNILSVNGKAVERFSDVANLKIFLENNVVITVERNGQVIDIPVPPDFLNKISKLKDYNFIGIRQTFYVKDIVQGSNAWKAGLLPGDIIIEAAGIPIQFFDEFKEALNNNSGKEMPVAVMRNDEKINLAVLVDEKGLIGIALGFEELNEEIIRYGIFESIGRGTYRAFETLALNIKGMGKIIRGEISASDNLTGPVGIAKVYGGTWDWQKFWILTGVLSIVLALMNILPIPALDGGFVMFLTYEAVTGKKLSDKFMENTQRVGMAILGALMVLIIGNDIWKLIAG